MFTVDRTIGIGSLLPWGTQSAQLSQLYTMNSSVNIQKRMVVFSNGNDGKEQADPIIVKMSYCYAQFLEPFSANFSNGSMELTVPIAPLVAIQLINGEGINYRCPNLMGLKYCCSFHIQVKVFLLASSIIFFLAE